MASPSHALSLLFLSYFLLAMANQSFSCPSHCEDEINLCLYLHQVATGANRNQEVMVQSPNPTGFGTIAVNDWTIIDAPESNATIVAHAKGMHVQAGQAWFTSLSIVFDGNSFTGSTLLVMGITDANGQWAIVGGTGVFRMAHGTINHKVVKNTPFVENYRELDIHVFYVPATVNATGTAIQ